MHGFIGQQGMIRVQGMRGFLRDIRQQSPVRQDRMIGLQRLIGIFGVHRLIGQQGMIRFQRMIGCQGMKRFRVVEDDFQLHRMAGVSVFFAVQFHPNRIRWIGDEGKPMVHAGVVKPECDKWRDVNSHVFICSFIRNEYGEIRGRADRWSGAIGDRELIPSLQHLMDIDRAGILDIVHKQTHCRPRDRHAGRYRGQVETHKSTEIRRIGLVIIVVTRLIRILTAHFERRYGSVIPVRPTLIHTRVVRHVQRESETCICC